MIYINEHINDINLSVALQEISEQRREQALKFKNELGQRLCVAAYLLLKQGLREEYGIIDNPIFGYGDYGKPFIVDHPDIFFNMSHCREAAICVLSDSPVGVDIETIRSFKESLVNYTMNESECNQIENADHPEVEFIRLWTMKESLMKLTGKGISNNMKDILTDEVDFTTVECLDRGYIYTIARKRETLATEKKLFTLAV